MGVVDDQPGGGGPGDLERLSTDAGEQLAYAKTSIRKNKAIAGEAVDLERVLGQLPMSGAFSPMAQRIALEVRTAPMPKQYRDMVDRMIGQLLQLEASMSNYPGFEEAARHIGLAAAAMKRADGQPT